MAIQVLPRSLLPVILTCHDLLKIVSANSMLSQAIVLQFRLLSWACLRNIYGEKQAVALVWGSREDAQMTQAVVGNQCCSFWLKGF